MKKALLLALPLAALTLAVACKKQEAAVTEQPVATEQVAGTAVEAAPVAVTPAATPVATPAVTPAAKPAAKKKGK